MKDIDLLIRETAGGIQQSINFRVGEFTTVTFDDICEEAIRTCLRDVLNERAKLIKALKKIHELGPLVAPPDKNHIVVFEIARKVLKEVGQ